MAGNPVQKTKARWQKKEGTVSSQAGLLEEVKFKSDDFKTEKSLKNN